MRIAIVDDEGSYINQISEICRSFGNEKGIVMEIKAFYDGDSFLSSLPSFGVSGYDIVFMDIFMGSTDGVSAAKILREQDSGCIIIFLTSCGERMPDAFSCHAFEYVLKPAEEKRITEVLSDALKLIPTESKYIDLYSDRKTIRVSADKIASVVTDAHYLNIGLADGTAVRSRMTMPRFIEQINGDPRFIYINKGITINAEYVADFDNSCCIMENGERFPLRIRDRLKIEQAVRDYNFGKIRSTQKREKE